MKLIDVGISILNKINNLGYEAYFVGGMPRDLFLGKKVFTDIDIAVSCDIVLLIPFFNVIEDNSRYLNIKIMEEGYIFEITSYRKDISYSDHRHPKTELAMSLKEDLLRRDFTINAMFCDKKLIVHDFFNGKKDLKNQIIQTIIDPYKSFQDDALRMLRACYFASKLDFSIDNNTFEAILKNRHLIHFLSIDRIHKEIVKIIHTNNNRGFKYIKESQLLDGYFYNQVINYLLKNNIKIKSEINFFLLANHLKLTIPLNISKENKKILNKMNLFTIENINVHDFIDEDIEIIKIILLFFKDIMKIDKTYLLDQYDNLEIKRLKDIDISKQNLEKIEPKKRKTYLKKLANLINNYKILNNSDVISKYINEEDYE